MTFQISAIYLFGVNQRVREIGFETGAINIITGRSQRGKSSIINIIDYCLASNSFTVPAGIIRQVVRGYGLRLVGRDGEALLVRPAPEPGRSTSGRFHVSFGQLPAGAPDYDSLDFNSTISGARDFLNRFSGIEENLNVPVTGTRDPLAATIRHALFFVFQAQDEIASRNVLFHSQADEFRPQAIRDSLPYFLGAQDHEFVYKRNRLNELRRELRSIDRKLDERNAIQMASGQARALLREAIQVGLIDDQPSITAQEEVVSLLRSVVDDPREPQGDQRDTDTYDELAADRERLRARFSWLRSEIFSLRQAQLERREYSAEISEQRARLQSIGLLNVSQDEEARICPLCDSPLSRPVAGADELRQTLTRINSEIVAVQAAEPELSILERRYQDELQSLREQLRTNQEQLDEISASRRQLAAARDDAVRAAVVQGRIGLYLDSQAFVALPEVPGGRRAGLIEEIARLEDDLDASNMQDRLESILSRVSQSLEAKARSIGLEHSSNPLRLDVRRLTLVSDTSDGPITLAQIGSGENWLGYHVCLFAALHQWFVEQSRPVPRFLILDQPSQVYFPPDVAPDDTELRDDDRESLGRILEIVLRLVEDLAPELQVFIMDHADLDEEWFQKAVTQRWRGVGEEDALIPSSWLSDPDSGSTGDT
ncbi:MULTISPECIES: DUF3732 domain-containing protein [unclassified Micromonospora]|uniref:DUF3732 domain-containing protein n=1 Tax=unclassified Micromonospora TaxID=2617518 RepID=UPI002FEF163A